MSDIQLYLLEYEKSKSDARAVAAQSAIKLQDKQLKLIDLISSLEEYINNKDDASLRARSLGYLADTLEVLPAQVLSGQERRLLTDFILGRLEGDVEGIEASSRALVSLERLGKWDRDTAQKVARTYMDYAHPLRQFKLQMERFSVIQLINLLFAKYREPLKELHDSDANFMDKFVSFFEGEKDPRNLMAIFSILRAPMTEWDVRKQAQDLFEAVFNYFPITFKPPPDDPYGITAQDLKDRLRSCIASNSDFAPYAIPALLDKLDSTSMNTKRDVLKAIQACIVGYGARTMNLYSVTLWDALKFEVLNLQEEDLAEDSMKALTFLGVAFADAETDGALNAYLRPIVKECNEHLEDAPTKQSSASGRILYTVGAGDLKVADHLAKGIIPTLLNLYQASQSIAKRRGLLDVFNQITKSYVELSNFAAMTIDVEVLQKLIPDAFEAMLLALISAPKLEVSFRLTALHGLSQLVELPGLLSDKDTHRVIDAVTDIILHESLGENRTVREEAIKALTRMAHHVPSAVRDRAIPAYMAQLPDVPPATEIDKAGETVQALADLSREQQIFDTVVLRLRNKFNAACHQKAPLEYLQLLVLGSFWAFLHGRPLKDENGIIRSSYFTEYAAPLMKMVRENADSEPDELIFEVVGRLCNAILRSQGVHFQTRVYNENMEWLSPVNNPDMTETNVGRLSPFSRYYYAAIRPEVVDANDILALLRIQVMSALTTAKDVERITPALQSIRLIVNKFINPAAMATTLESANIDVESLLAGEQTTNRTTVAFSILKALLVQGKCGPLTSRYLSLFIKQLPSSNKLFADSFATLLAPGDMLTKENHCVISGLYKQKTFNIAVPAIIDAVRTATPVSKPSYLIALSGIIRYLPYETLEPSLGKLIPPLLQILDLPDPTSTCDQGAKASSLAIFENVLSSNPSAFTEHTSSLITRLINCTAVPDPEAVESFGKEEKNTHSQFRSRDLDQNQNPLEPTPSPSLIRASDPDPKSISHATSTRSAPNLALPIPQQHAESSHPTSTSAAAAAAAAAADPTPRRGNSSAVRAAALTCLALLPAQLPRQAVMPYRRQVVKRLLTCLDDPKRSVRAEAVRCRGRWFGLEEEDEEEGGTE